MRLHPRYQVVRAAGHALGEALEGLRREHDLTEVEWLRLLLDEQQEITKYMLRTERHPDDPEHKADEE